MMPGMKTRRVDDVSQRPKVPSQIGVAQLLDQQRENQDAEYDAIAHAEHNEWEINHRLIDDHFKPVRTKRRDPIKLLDAVMELVKPPKPWNEVKAPMNIPFEEITDDEENHKLNPDR